MFEKPNLDENYSISSRVFVTKINDEYAVYIDIDLPDVDENDMIPLELFEQLQEGFKFGIQKVQKLLDSL